MTPRREYFYWIDREGVLWHDGTPLDDPGFLQTFFAHVRPNDTGRHPDYPFVSPCGPEWNYVAAEATVIVFRRWVGGMLEANGGIRVRFDPHQLRVNAQGWLYHLAPVADHGLIRSALVTQLAAQIEPRGEEFVWVGVDGPVVIGACE